MCVPINIKDVLNDPTWAAEWQAALENELSNLLEHDVFKVVPISADGIDNVVDTKVVFKCKSDPLGFIESPRSELWRGVHRDPWRGLLVLICARCSWGNI